MRRLDSMRLITALLCACTLASGDTHAAPSVDRSAAENSRSASRVYAQAKPSLFQVRVLTAAGRSQVTAGSGFVVTGDGLAVTNYHVVSKLVLEPRRFVGQTLSTTGETGEMEVLKVDVLRDLALIRLTGGKRPALTLRTGELAQGERVFSLGNPLDLGFAISEGAFNGEVTRPYYPQMLFSGAINPGMSGGPAVDSAGSVVGVNVSKRRDGEQISFLIPARFVSELMTGVAAAREPSHEVFRQDIALQLSAHQETMTAALLAHPLPTRPMGPYLAPVTEAKGIRCWAGESDDPQRIYRVTNLSCRTETQPYVDEELRTGFINVTHEYIAAEKLEPFQFLKLYSRSYRNEKFGTARDKQWTRPECNDAFVQGKAANAVPLRAVLCVRALRRFEGLYDFALLVATVDDNHQGLRMRVDAGGVSFQNGQRIVQAFLNAMGTRP